MGPVINRPTDDDDIQEVVSVKSEPPPSQQEYQDPAGQAGQLQQYEAEIQYQEGYDDYGQYDTVGVVMDGAQGHDASKGEENLTFDNYIGRMEKEYFCEICQIFKHKSKHTVRTHVESRHFPNTFSYKCQICDQSCSSRKALENHMQ